ncbi:gibberellic acid methyltransferase 2-like isoform X1 [Pomacea canaliculata]|uniref:gibberellic acid methyltransferase 2-like isoform X1 n=1 Tax=Pomacea canaliculata TaxID=400727 RepID=UPI000D72B437|nr:gibberellic acid methyltransferase 2-like isoform X1 [Pomacea canaliculata]
MVMTVIPRLVNAAAVSHLSCLHLASLSSLQSRRWTSDGLAMKTVRRGMSETATEVKRTSDGLGTSATRRGMSGDKKHSFQYFWQPGSGYYGESLGRVSKVATDICENFVLSHIDAVPVPSPTGVFTIGDYGTCDGSVSLQLIHKIIDHLRNKHGPDLKIQVLYEDHPSSDYNSLFKTIYGQTSYLSKFNNVFPIVCGTNFYKQCVPDNTCDVIISFIGVHFLSEESYVRCSNTIFPWRSTSEEEMRVHREAAARDWRKFLLLRAAELKQGGLLFVTQLLTELGDNTSQFRDTNSSVTNITDTLQNGKDIYRNLDLAWNDLHTNGIITTEEFQSCTTLQAYRTLQELKDPFEDATMSPVRQAGLRILKGPEDFLSPCFMKTLWREKLQTDGVDDRKMFARRLVQAYRLVLDATLRNTLEKTRSTEEQSDIMDQLYECFVERVAACNPETFQSEPYVGRLVAQKLK